MGLMRGGNAASFACRYNAISRQIRIRRQTPLLRRSIVHRDGSPPNEPVKQ